MHHDPYLEAEVKLHTIYLGKYRGEISVSRYTHFILEEEASNSQQMRGWVAPRAGLVVTNRNPVPVDETAASHFTDVFTGFRFVSVSGP
jgi:hypothetical protein